MKKLKRWLILLAVIMLLATPAIALADAESGAETTTEFFTWSLLATYAGAVAATALIVQMTKGIGFIDRIPTRIYSYIIAVVILLTATYFIGGMTWSQAGLCLVNAAVVSLASNGAYGAIKKE